MEKFVCERSIAIFFDLPKISVGRVRTRKI